MQPPAMIYNAHTRSMDPVLVVICQYKPIRCYRIVLEKPNRTNENLP